ncbi:Dnajc2 [Symbiodinium sp. KB8]|nr:Dnajc2 [Symbiodinium sp. KB8]
MEAGHDANVGRRAATPEPATPKSIVGCLLAANAATFSLWAAAPHLGSSRLVGRWLAGHFMCSRWHLRHGRVHTLITSCLSHQRPTHFLVNSWGLWTLGRVAEELSVQEQLSVFTACCAGSSLGHVLCHRRPVLGASGLLMGLLSSGSLMQPERRFHVLFVGTFSMTQLCDVAFISNLIGYFLRARLPPIAWAAHLGGSAAGLGVGIVARFFGDSRFADPVRLRHQARHCLSRGPECASSARKGERASKGANMAGPGEPRRTRRLTGAAVCGLVLLAASRNMEGFLSQSMGSLRTLRRQVLTGAWLWSTSLAAATLDPDPAEARFKIVGLPCECCERDWCATTCIDVKQGQETKCNCHEFLSDYQSSEQLVVSGGLYKLPADAARARLDSIEAGQGEEGWADHLSWKTANLLKWNPEDGKNLQIKPSTLGETAGDGLFTTVPLPKYTVLPPYQGKPLSLAEFRKMRGTSEMDYVYCPLREEALFNFTDEQLQTAEQAGAATTFCVDGRVALEKNPVRFVNAARTKEQCKKVNVQICEFGDVAYFRTTKDVKKGSELITDYGSAYWEDFEGLASPSELISNVSARSALGWALAAPSSRHGRASEMARKHLRALLDDPESVGLNEVVCACCAPAQVVAGGCTAAANYRCEAAGRSFAARFEATDGQSSPSESDQAEEAEVGEDYTTGKGQDKSSGGYLKISDLLKGVNLYNLMGISEGASQDEIKKAYRGLALTAHPDKQAAMKPDEAKKVQENFVKIQEAYELLSDQSKRKQYDSSLDFDESLPKFRPESGQDFFQVFGEVFRRNARFSMKRPVPELGSLEDEPRVWKRFYDFWYGFQSWRDPVMLAQKAGEEICDLEEAECREERRWMMRENQRVARQYKQQERDRISKLVSLAEPFDPRIQVRNPAKRLAREAEAARREEERTAAKRAKEETGAMQCGKTSPVDLSKRLAAIEHRIEDVLQTLRQDHNITEGLLRQMEATVSRICEGQGRDGSLSASPRKPQSALVLSARSAKEANQVNPSERGSFKDLRTILRSDRVEAEAMESLPLLKVEKAEDRHKRHKYSTLNLEGMGIPFQERLARAQIPLEIYSKQSWMSKAVTDFLEDPDSSTFASSYFYGISIFTLLGMLFAFLPALNIELASAYKDLINVLIDSILLAETVIRFLCYPHAAMIFSGEQRWENLIDCASALPVLLLVLKDKFGEDFGSFGDAFLLAAMPMIRLLRLVRRFTYMQLLKAAFRDCLEALPVMLYIMIVMAYGFTSLLYLVEPRENMPTVAHAAWLVISTITTVGFGDVVPSTQSGLVLTSVLMVVSSLYMAMPFGIIGHSFTQIWGSRKRILLLQKTRSRLHKWGFGPHELPRLFGLFDLDDSAEIDLPEFKVLLNEMDIGFKDKEITELFKLIDKDSGGTIDEREFVKTLYPDEYRELYPKKRHDHAERQQREAEEALRLAEEQKRKEEKAKREAVKERVKKCRQRLRSFHPAVKDHVVLEQLNEVCLQFSEEQLRELGNQIEESLKESSPLAAASIFHKAIESIGLTPMKVSEDAQSTTSGPTDSQEEAPNQRESSEERRRAKENQAKMRIVEEQQAAEKARLAAERAEEKKKKEEQRRKDAAAAEAARRQQEKKEELKAKKAEERQKKQEDEEKARKEQQRELAKQKAQEQAQKDRQAAQAEKEKLELERLINLFAKDRLDRLAKLELLSDEKLAASLQTETEDSSLAGALLMVKAKLVTGEDSDSDPLERAIALVSEAAGGKGVWPLALTAPVHLRLENALRNRVKKARNRLREAVSSFLKSSKLPNADENAVTEWQRGIVDGTLELPPWSPQESEPKPAGTEKKKKEKPVEEDLDQILAEFDSSPPKSKKPGKKKK